MIKYECKKEDQRWSCGIHMLKSTEPYEMNLDVNGNRYHIIAGSHGHGNYICIPNWSIGSELASFNDTFWNTEQLSRQMNEKDAIGISEGLKLVHEIFEESF